MTEVFQNVLSLDKHPTLTRVIVGETCTWCIDRAGTHIHPSGEDFARYRNCDCLFVVSGYNSRNGILKNYVKRDARLTDEQAMKAVGVSEDYWYNKMENSERMFARNYPEQITWIDRMSKGKDGLVKPTNDYTLLKSGREYELKTPERARYSAIASSIRNAVSRAPEIKQRFMINLQNKHITDKLMGDLAKYNKRNPNNMITELRIFSYTDGERVIKLLE